jgi:hypothetical protein
MMAKTIERKEAPRPQPTAGKAGAEPERLPFRTRNYVLFGAGLAVIVAGWFLLRAGHITIAPIMLVLGYCGILPLAIVLK